MNITGSAVFLAPAPGWSTQCSSGNTYTADADGRIVAPFANDTRDLLNSGCIPLVAGDLLLGKLSANMNVTTDQAIPFTVPNGLSWVARRITARNAPVSLTTAAGGVYDAASKGGTAIVAAGQAYSALTAAGLYLDLTIAAAGKKLLTSTATLFLSLTTGQGAPATADLYVYGEIVY